MEEPLWQPAPERIRTSNLSAFMARLARELGAGFTDMASLHRWSIDNPEAFWSALWDFSGVIGIKGAAPYLIDPSAMPGARFFPEARLNFAENLLRRRDQSD